jgi:thiol-disulfide isomerase/thioredoxin
MKALIAAVVVLGLVGTLVYVAVSPPNPVALHAAPAATPAKSGLRFSVHKTPQPLPDIPFADGEGGPVKLSDFRGKVVLLNVRATWCPPCREEMPSLDRLQGKLGGSDFEVIAFSIDRGGAFVVKSFYNELDLKHLKIYLDQSNQASNALRVVGVPTTLLIDRQGREIGRMAGSAQWDSEEALTLIRGHLGASK